MKVLIVDDSPFIALVCRQALEKSGYQVVGEAFDGQKGFEMARDLKPEIVIMDIALPVKNGFETTQSILEILPETKILAISALDEDSIREKAIASGCFDFLAKPFEAENLVQAIRSVSENEEGLKYG